MCTSMKCKFPFDVQKESILFQNANILIDGVIERFLLVGELVEVDEQSEAEEALRHHHHNELGWIAAVIKDGNESMKNDGNVLVDLCLC